MSTAADSAGKASLRASSAQPRLTSRNLLLRALRALERAAELRYLRLAYGQSAFGDRCEVRLGHHFSVAQGGEVRFGEGCIIDRGMTVEVSGTLEVGPCTIFGHHCTVAARSSVRIGANCLIAELVSIRDHDHDFATLDLPTRDQGQVIADVVVGSNVWLGSKVTVLKGVTIGDNAVIGAGAVVSRDVPDNAIAVGVPARVVRYR
jgi:acetyltransferase-like isoleucine patch superfamily enzyme